MELSALLKEEGTTRRISMDVPLFNHPLIPIAMVDPRWARPTVFHNMANYPFDEAANVQADFNKLVDSVNQIQSKSVIDRYLAGLLRVVDSHYKQHRRVLFPDLLLYVDCMAYLCYASDFMTESEVNRNYVKWLKYVVDNRGSQLYASTMFGPCPFSGSQNESDYESCF